MIMYANRCCVRMSVGTTATACEIGSACWTRTNDPLINSQQAESLRANGNAAYNRFTRTRKSQRHPVTGHSWGFLCTPFERDSNPANCPALSIRVPRTRIPTGSGSTSPPSKCHAWGQKLGVTPDHLVMRKVLR